MKSILASLFLLLGLGARAQETITLVEQFTGFKCVFCPEAMELMDSLEAEFQDSVIFVNIHAGLFAEANTSGSDFLVDLTSQQGIEYYDFCQPQGIPSAMISRRVNPSIPQVLYYSKNEWRNRISEIVAIPKPVDMNLSCTYNSVSNEFTITVQNELLIDHTGDHNIVYYIVENNVVTDQKLLNNTINPSYAHQHVLRDVLNPTWGDLLFSGTTNAGTILPHSIQYTPISTIQNLNNCTIIAYIRNVNNDEIIQAAKVEINDLILGSEETVLGNLIIYPNPVSDQLFVQYTTGNQVVSIHVTDELGRIMLEEDALPASGGTLDFSRIGAGTYFIALMDSDGVILTTEKVVKID